MPDTRSGAVVGEREWRSLMLVLALADVAGLLAAAIAAGWLVSQAALGAHADPGYPTLIALMVPTTEAIFVTQGLYDRSNLLFGTGEYAAIFRGCTYGLVALILLGFAFRRPPPREWLVLSWLLASGLIGATRLTIRRVANRLRRNGHLMTHAIVVGADADSVAVAGQLNAPESGVRVIGFLDDYTPPGSIVTDGLKVLGTPAMLLQVAKRTGVEEAIVVPQALPWETVQGLLADATAAPNGLRVHISAGFYDLLTSGVRLSERNHVPLLTVNKARLSAFEAAFKRTLDCILASALLVLCAPMMVVLAIRLAKPGPVLERQPVMGRYAERFEQRHFRAAPFLRSPFLRKLPSLFSVLAGHLSLVGPRPIPEQNQAARVLTIRPGLTGPWRDLSDPREQELLDLYYIRSYSVWLDMQVLFRRLRSHLSLPARRMLGTR